MAICGYEFPSGICCGQRDGHTGDHIPYGAGSRYQPCPSEGCGEPVDTWLAGTTAAHRTDKGVMHADCYLYEQYGDDVPPEAIWP